MQRLLGYGEKVISFLEKPLGVHPKKPGKKRLITEWPKDFRSFLLLVAQEIGQEDILAALSLILLFCLSLALVHLPKISLASVFVTLVIFANIFLSKLLLLSSSFRIMTKKSLFLKQPSISEFLFAFPLDYFAIALSFSNFYLFTSRVSGQAFTNTKGPYSPLDLGDSLVYSLSCITTLDLSEVVAATMWAKLLSFTELMLGIFFLIVFGSMIMGLFLTEKETSEQKDYVEEKKQLFDSLSAVFGPVVHKLAGLLKDAELSAVEPEIASTSPEPTKKLVFSITYPDSSRFKGFRLMLPCCRLKEWVGLLPLSARKRLSDAGFPLQGIVGKIDEGFSGAISTMEWADKRRG